VKDAGKISPRRFTGGISSANWGRRRKIYPLREKAPPERKDLGAGRGHKTQLSSEPGEKTKLQPFRRKKEKKSVGSRKKRS